MAGAQPAARQAPASAEVTARRLPLATIVLGALVVLVGLSVLDGIAARKPFDGVVLIGVLTAVLGWLITRRQPGNRIGLLLAGFGALLVCYEDAANYAVLDYHLHLPDRGDLQPAGVHHPRHLEVPPVRHRPADQPHAFLHAGHRAAGRYAGLVLLATEVFRFRGTVAVAASTLAVAALFNPLRRRVQRVIDRRFNRARYDADQTVAALAARLKDEVDLDSIRDDLAGAVHQALEPAHISVWVSRRT